MFTVPVRVGDVVDVLFLHGRLAGVRTALVEKIMPPSTARAWPILRVAVEIGPTLLVDAFVSEEFVVVSCS